VFQDQWQLGRSTWMTRLSKHVRLDGHFSVLLYAAFT
jgi:hypothetical protein